MQVVLFLLFLLPIKVIGQIDSAASRMVVLDYKLQAGVGYSGIVYVEVGFSRMKAWSTGHHHFTSALYISNEFHFANRIQVAPKIGTWISGGSSAIGIGANLLYYSDFSAGKLVFRPELGIGATCGRIYYGYNLFVSKSDLAVPRNMVGITAWVF